MLGITVGVDGSENSQDALEWAMREAGLRYVPLTVLTVHEVAASHWAAVPITYSDDDALTAKVRQAAEEVVAGVASRLGDMQPPSVDVRAVSGYAAQELIEASRDSDLLVVGTRGNGGFARLLLGSVSSKVVHHTACPVVVVPMAATCGRPA